jgi:hypothetical protein
MNFVFVSKKEIEKQIEIYKSGKIFVIYIFISSKLKDEFMRLRYNQKT